ncbi:SpoIIIAH-like family protein [Sporosarcina sp. G11-34]|uniref:SpoIIIAH-like family protein n=1 Tax=Sporosarcina sp. G11-34 TaxID=2849605 RepID=UPI0022A95C36|nr:SpoIIIAH-like family protein [Sporosarcina sp. G11-34]MCZ2260105.1 SpoIIIAH-like family protein [Sporosarcina sp. G11-34]
MKANKRTVWFLTLISLVAVISIFYINNKTPMPFDGLALFGDKTPTSEIAKDQAKGTDEQAPVFAESYIFDDMRMTVRNERSQLNEQLTTKVGSPDFTSVEKNDALDEMAALTRQDSAEALMEMQIKALGYPDAFVQTDSGHVNVTVLSQDGQSVQQANEITHLVMTTWAEARTVKVDFEGGS